MEGGDSTDVDAEMSIACGLEFREGSGRSQISPVLYQGGCKFPVSVKPCSQQLSNPQPQVERKSPFSSFFGLGENQTGLLTANQNYQVGIAGTAVGVFSLQFNQVDSSGNVIQAWSFTNVPIGTASTGSLTLSPTGGPPVLELDIDGDGVIDVSLTANSTVDAGAEAHILSLIIPTLSLRPWLEKSLLAKIGAANAALNAGRPCEAKHIFVALKHEIAAQIGKHMPVSEAKGLLVIVDDLIRQIDAHCSKERGESPATPGPVSEQ